MAEVATRLPVGDDEVAVRWARPDGAEPALAVFYCHGFGSSQSGTKADDFRARALAAGFGFCSFDFRGHGASGGELPHLTFSHCLEDAAAVCDWLAEPEGGDYRGPLAFFASSMGAAAALWFAGRHPGRFVAGAAIAPALEMHRAFAERCGEAGLASWRDSGFLAFGNELVESQLGWGLMEDLARYPFEELAASYRVPTLIFQGMRDEQVEWRTATGFAAAVGEGVEVHLFAGGEHRLLEERGRMWGMVEEFFRRIEGAEAAGLAPDGR